MFEFLFVFVYMQKDLTYVMLDNASISFNLENVKKAGVVILAFYHTREHETRQVTDV